MTKTKAMTMKDTENFQELELPKNPYAKLTNDFVFKRIFGTEATKDILMMFLNHMIGSPKIANVRIRNAEHLGMTSKDRKAVFDINCSTEEGEEFIVEMQHASQEYFRERATYYTSYPTIEQGEIAKSKYFEEHGTTAGFSWDFNLKHIKFIAILSFRMEHEKSWPEERFSSSYHIREDTNHELMHDKHQYIFLELPRFKKRIDELENEYDRWVYLFKNMHKFTERPKEFSGKEYDRLFEMTEFANFTAEDYKRYQEAEKMFNDNQNCLNYAEKRGYLQGVEDGLARGREMGRAEGREEGREEGKEKGREEGREEGERCMAMKIAQRMLEQGLSHEDIARMTGLSISDLKG